MIVPFRWNITKREQLGRLIKSEGALPYPTFADELLECCARIFSFCDNADLYFIGRSPESLFDYLSGLLAPTSWANRCVLLNLALRNYMFDSHHRSYPTLLRHTDPRSIALVRNHLQVLKLTPHDIITCQRKVAFVDLVASGTTFKHLAEILFEWTRESRLSLKALKQHLCFIGITPRKKTSPNTWRWQQQHRWVQQLRPGTIKNVSIPGYLWDYLGNYQQKVTPSNPPWRWDDRQMSQPSYNGATLAALELAVHLYDLGNSAEHRRRFAAQLARAPGIKHQWYRAIMHEVRRVG
ncbi:MAG: hypothetical protein AAGF95_05940 [Chloroflexota bacterium]